jgi:hypothetical protein
VHAAARLAALAALVAAGAAAGEGLADEGRAWILDDAGEAVSLVYGTPETDDVLIGFSCGPERVLTVTYFFEPADARDGMTAEIELVTAAGHRLVKARGERSLLDDAFVLEGRTRLDAALARILGKGGTLAIAVRGSVDEVPLAGAEAGIAALVARCAV